MPSGSIIFVRRQKSPRLCDSRQNNLDGLIAPELREKHVFLILKWTIKPTINHVGVHLFLPLPFTRWFDGCRRSSAYKTAKTRLHCSSRTRCGSSRWQAVLWSQTSWRGLKNICQSSPCKPEQTADTVRESDTIKTKQTDVLSTPWLSLAGIWAICHVRWMRTEQRIVYLSLLVCLPCWMLSSILDNRWPCLVSNMTPSWETGLVSLFLSAKPAKVRLMSFRYTSVEWSDKASRWNKRGLCFFNKHGRRCPHSAE